MNQATNTIHLKGSQGKVCIPIRKSIKKQNRIIIVPKECVTVKVQPVIQRQHIYHEIPKLIINWSDRNIDIPKFNIVEKVVDVPVEVGQLPRYVPTWDQLEVPRVYPFYTGARETVKVPMPKVQYNDEHAYKERIVGEVTKRVPRYEYKDVPVYKYVDVIKEIDEDIDVIFYRPNYDVQIDTDPLMLLPYPEIDYETLPPEIVDNAAIVTLANQQHDEFFQRQLHGADPDVQGAQPLSTAAVTFKNTVEHNSIPSAQFVAAPERSALCDSVGACQPSVAQTDSRFDLRTQAVEIKVLQPDADDLTSQTEDDAPAF